MANNPSHYSPDQDAANAGLTVFGGDPNGSPPTHNPILIAGSDGTDVRTVLTDAAGRLEVDAIHSPLPAGTNVIGKVGIDQTTPGTTNAVQVTNLPATVDTNTGNASASTPRVVLASNQPSITVHDSAFPTTFDLNAGAAGASTLRVVIGTGGATPLPTGAATQTTLAALLAVFPTTLDLNQGSAGASTLRTAVANLPTTVDTNSGNKSSSTLRFVLATDQPNLTTALNVQVTAALPAGTNNVGTVFAVGPAATSATPIGGPVYVGLNGPGNVVLPLASTTLGDNVTQGEPLNVQSIGFAFNNSTYDRSRNSSAANLSRSNQPDSLVVQGPGQWNITSLPGGNAQATATRAAGATGVRHVAKNFTYVLCSFNVNTAINETVYLRDGASGVGSVIWGAYISIPATFGATTILSPGPLDIIGSPATAMTIEFGSAAGANTAESVALMGVDVI